MAKPPSREPSRFPLDHNSRGASPSDDSTGGSPPDGGGPPSGPDAATAITLGAATAVIETAADPVGIANKLLNFERGRKFEKDVLEELELPETKKKRISVIMNDGTLVTVIPDAQSTTLITEVKDVANLYNSKQFRAYLATNRRIDLIVSPNTKTISGPLQLLIKESRGSIRVFDPATKSFRPWDPE